MNEIENVLLKSYGIRKATIKKLEGYANSNYKIELPNGKRYVLKQHANESGLSDLFVAEGKILSELSMKFPGRFQEPVYDLEGNYLVRTESDDDLIRMLKWVEGEFYHQAEHTEELFRSAGKQFAEMDLLLQKESQPIIEGRKTGWDLQYLLDQEHYVGEIKDSDLRKKVHYFFMQYKLHVIPKISRLRKSIIHNDLNDWNLFVDEHALSGIIDFGDLVFAPIIQELAVHLAYALFDKEDPLSWASYVLEAYHEVLPLEQEELDLLYYLIAGRICQSLIHSAASGSSHPENEYLSVSEQQMARLLDKWLEINPVNASRVFKSACGIIMHPIKSVEESLKDRFLHISKAQSVSYKRPVKMVGAAFQYMYDAYGNTLLDAYNNIPHVGHSHPAVVEAGQRQMARLNTNTRYIYEELAEYSEKLIARFPDPLNKVFFVNSGSAASDLALRMAQTRTGCENILVLEHGYHGHTRLGIDISHYKYGRSGGSGQSSHILQASIPDTYRGKYTDNSGPAGQSYANDVLSQMKDFNRGVGAFIAEPIVGCAGQVPLAKDYLKNIYPAIRKQGGVCISDEVQTGFGRLGSVFWGFELQEVIPDIVILGKPMGNGHPIGAVVTTDEIAASFDNGMEFFSSFGGNPVSCAIGSALLDVIEEEGLQQHAYQTGNHFMKLLEEVKREFECVGDIRGSGLFLGMELVTDPMSKNHHPELAGQIKNELRNNCILVSTDGPFDNIIKMKPPLCFNTQNADRVVEEMFRIIKSNLLTNG